jgi:hypothetical protein
MKKVTLVIILLCSCIAGFAQTLSASIEKFKSTDNFVINVNNPAGSRILLQIRDSKKQAIWQESILYAEKLKRVLFLGSLDPGEYSFEVSNGDETKTETVVIAGKDKTTHPENGKTLVVGFSKPKADNSIDIIVQNKLTKNVSLKVFKNNTLFMEQDLGKDEIAKKILKLPETEKGDFIVRVGTGDNLYQYKLSKQ